MASRFALSQYCLELLCSQFLSLTLVTHEFERTLGFFVRSRHFFLYLGGSLFHLRRETHVAVILHARARRNEASDDDVFLESTQVVHGALDGSFREHACGLLE